MIITDTITTQVKSLVEDVKGLPATIKKVDVKHLRSQAEDFAKTARTQATGVYADLTKKGEEARLEGQGSQGRRPQEDRRGRAEEG